MVFMVMGPETTPSSACVCVAWLVMGPIGIVRHTHLVAVGDPPAAAATWNLLLRGDPLPYNLLAPPQLFLFLTKSNSPRPGRRSTSKRSAGNQVGPSSFQPLIHYTKSPLSLSLYSTKMLSGCLINLTSQTNKKKIQHFQSAAELELDRPARVAQTETFDFRESF